MEEENLITENPIAIDEPQPEPQQVAPITHEVVSEIINQIVEETKPVVEEKPATEENTTSEEKPATNSEVKDFYKNLKETLSSKDSLDKYRTKLSEPVCKVFLTFLNKNEIIFNQINDLIRLELSEITEKSKFDEKICISNIMEFAGMFKKLYEAYYTADLKGIDKQSRAEVCAIIFKFILEYVIHNETKINETIDVFNKLKENAPTHIVEKLNRTPILDVVNNIDKVIDTTVYMINLKKNLKGLKKNIFSCL